ncbi:CRISPR-associated endonuclease Cas3'' [Aquabacterium sp.]|uniref:CRISPR-associated endonuclease Cas3'' n=1 Tax=Aquabacterium sp. TaxID=1872578 RepID=UPI0025C26EB9|nr:CRISPR-associated endonuclease Cas3'' [Aquabacterium sp.]
MSSDNWAHIRVDAVTGEVVPHLLADHLGKVAGLAARFASDFGEDWARLAGLLHDLGKYRSGFQRYIRQANGLDAHIEGRVKDSDKTHSAAGALWAEQLLARELGPQGQMMARVLQYVIAGHHAGLDNWDDGLAARLASDDAQRELADALAADPPLSVLRPDLAGLSLKDLPIGREGADTPGRFALWLRMLFSALVDADFLDTESFMDQGKGVARRGAPSIQALQSALNNHLTSLVSSAADTPVNRVRQGILAQCRSKAIQDAGVFTLTVPTGGGKTLSSLAFALDHAALRGKRRVVYAIPYTSIIEQTADIFRKVFAELGEDAVIEHHSNAETEPERETSRSRLACENWDAPLVVTTNVQLFESLFARRTSRCRKLHNLAHSVIVLDEAQLLPVEFLQPIVDVLRLLVRDFGVTLVLCTATQPVLTASVSQDPRRGLRRGFEASAVTEIIDDVPGLYAALERVRVHVPTDLNEARAWPELADEIAGHEAVLTVVSRRADAQLLFNLVRQHDPDGCWHLSALMCAQHRSDVIAEIKAALVQRRAALSAGLAAAPVRVVSTQLVEAGVDLDFPVVYRALAGLDSIAQAAGRCNREGKLPGLGEVHVFVPPTKAPPGLLRQARETCKTLWSEGTDNPFALPLFERYFQKLYHDADLDAKGICEAVHLEADQRERTLAVRFKDASDNFRLIDDADAATVLVRYRSPGAKEDINALIGMLERDGPSRWLMRKLQRYGVTVYRYQLDKLVKAGDIREVPMCPGLYVQIEDWDAFYHPQLGANVDGAPGDPASYVVSA